MSSAAEVAQSERLARFHRAAKVMGCNREAWLERLEAELEKLPNGTILVIK